MKVCLMRAALLFLATCTPLLAAAPPLPAEHTICESGRIMTITLNAQGHEAA
jgi:hypothetical protein